MGEQGLLFSMDLLCTFFGICLIALVSMQCIHNSIEANAEQLRGFELEKNTIMLLDIMVKNRNEQNPALGAAVFNAEKHRVEENKIDTALLKQANPLVAKNVLLKKISLQFKDGEKKTILETASGKNCLAITRMVLVEGKKALLEGVVCIE